MTGLLHTACVTDGFGSDEFWELSLGEIEEKLETLQKRARGLNWNCDAPQRYYRLDRQVRRCWWVDKMVQWAVELKSRCKPLELVHFASRKGLVKG